MAAPALSGLIPMDACKMIHLSIGTFWWGLSFKTRSNAKAIICFGRLSHLGV